MDTSRPRYGRCTDCGEIKHVGGDGLLREHNRYRVDGTSVAVVRCPGSDHRPDEPVVERATA